MHSRSFTLPSLSSAFAGEPPGRTVPSRNLDKRRKKCRA